MSADQLQDLSLPKPGRLSRFLRGLCLQVAIILVTLGAVEVMLRVVDLRFLRDGHQAGYPLVHHYDSELGWAPIPNSASKFVGSRAINVQHNSLGLRDIEHDRAAKPTILFVGDSFVWGYDVEAGDRFTERLQQQMAGTRIVNAGVPGYGTDQEYLLLRRLWSAVEPNVVVLMFCAENDRLDNTSDSRYDGYYKPYLEQAPDGSWQFRGQPVPKSRHVYFIDDWLVRNLWVARVAVSVYVQLRHPRISVPDPTEQLVGMMRDFVEARGAKFLVGLQYREPQLEQFLRAQKISYTSFEGAETYRADGNHWTPSGHALVAEALGSLFSRTGIVQAQPKQ